jgi:hypothetical protein
MRSARILALALVLLVEGAGGAAAQDNAMFPIEQTFGNPVFMFTPAERARLQDAREARQRREEARDRAAQQPAATGEEADKDQGEGAAAPAQAPPPLHPVYLSAILYLDDGRWTFWLNGERFTPGTTHPAFTVRRVTPDRVRVRWAPSGRSTRYTFTLAPRQSFNPATGRVVDGRLRPPAPRSGTRPAGPSEEGGT